MKIGIITPSYNQGRFLKDTIQSIIGQTRFVDYYAVYDSCSTDNTREVLSGYKKNPRVTKIIVEKDDGQAAAIQRGFSEMPSDIEIMAYLNSDDRLAPTAVATVMALFEANPTIDLITGSRRIIGSRGRLGMRVPSYPRSDADFYLNAGLNQEATFWRRSLYERAGNKVDPSYKFALDYDLWFRMRAAGWSPLYVKNVLGHFRIHSLSKTTMQIETTSVSELNRLRAERNLPQLTRDQFFDQVKKLEAREKGFVGFWWWRIKCQLMKRVLLPYYL